MTLGGSTSLKIKLSYNQFVRVSVDTDEVTFKPDRDNPSIRQV